MKLIISLNVISLRFKKM